MLRLMTYNICSARDHTQDERIDPEAYARALQPFELDLLLMNEVRGWHRDERSQWGQTEALREGLQMPYSGFAEGFARGDLGTYGNAILSRCPIETLERLAIPDPPMETRDPNGYYETRCLLRAVVTLPDGTRIAVYGSHFGLNADEKRSAVDTVCRALEAETLPWVFAGDLNMTPDDPILKPLYALGRDAALEAEVNGATYPTEAPKIRIDYIFLSPEWALHQVEVPKLLTSDHVPVMATLSL